LRKFSHEILFVKIELIFAILTKTLRYLNLFVVNHYDGLLLLHRKYYTMIRY